MNIAPSRIWEIDFFRGVAILMMVTFHLVFDLNAYWGYDLNYTGGFWYYEGKLSAILFMAIAGVSSALRVFHFRRGLVVFAWGMLITLVTYVYSPEAYIRFGILHMLGSCMMLFPLVKNRNPVWLLALGTVAIISGQWTAQLISPSSLLLLFGVTPAGFVSLDYYPLLPWSGLFLYGSALGKVIYKERRSRFQQPAWLQSLTALGSHSLTVYLIHQPMLLAALFILHRLLNL